ncbi:hypothetical protein G8Y85_00355 [Staphylococcus sp. 11007852]|uniref:coagulase domain-containing protein n=1 Tax=Staphylococcus TaxID=1279 RepID=UPI0014026120|nr:MULTISPECIES: coagulase domain-containing protein [Staphylococcus]NHM73885.1 hypothetical protein [Staphylococcus sp. 11007852]NJH83232.1 hypothetical protein [Staphylococcus agnetis]
MKKKLLVLSASAILASNFIFDNNASALVKETKHKSEALKMGWNGYSQFSKKQYEDDFKDLTHRISLNEHGGFDEIEYKEAYQKYQDVFLGELDAFNQLILKLDSNEEGMTSQKYNIIREKLKQNKIEFITKVKEIESTKKDLKRFKEGDDDFYKAIDKVYELEDKVFMVMSSFSSRKNSDALDELYNKLFLIVGTTPEERLDKLPKNQRMLGEMCENLETIIDDFFKEIGYERPKDIVPLTDDNKDDFEARIKLREAALKANTDESFRDPNVKVRAEKAKAKLAEITKKSSEAKAKAEAERKAKAVSMPLKSYRNDPEAFPHKQLRNELSIKFPESSPQLPIYTVTSESQTLPVLKQQVKEEKVDVLKSKRPEGALKGMEGVSAPVTAVSEPAFNVTAAPQQKIVEDNTGLSGSNNNLASMGGESKEVSFTYDSQPVDFDIITESNEIVLDQHTDIKVSGYTTGESIEDSRPSNEVTK